MPIFDPDCTAKVIFNQSALTSSSFRLRCSQFSPSAIARREIKLICREQGLNPDSLAQQPTSTAARPLGSLGRFGSRFGQLLGTAGFIQLTEAIQ